MSQNLKQNRLIPLYGWYEGIQEDPPFFACGIDLSWCFLRSVLGHWLLTPFFSELATPKGM
jgi:hypothetical protein